MELEQKRSGLVNICTTIKHIQKKVYQSSVSSFPSGNISEQMLIKNNCLPETEDVSVQDLEEAFLWSHWIEELTILGHHFEVNSNFQFLLVGGKKLEVHYLLY